MKRVLITIALCLLVATPALADLKVKVFYGGDVTGQYRQGAGGEFTSQMVLDGSTDWDTSMLDAYSPSTKNVLSYDNSFQSFCLEFNEFLGGSGATYSATINTFAEKGGTGVNAGGAGTLGVMDVLSKGSVYLYKQFATGALPGTIYDYTPGAARASSAETLQKAFWALENEDNGSISASIATYLKSQFGAASDLEVWRQDATDFMGVRAMNITDAQGNHYQSQLMLVPVPGAFLIGMIGLGYAGMRLRKMA